MEKKMKYKGISNERNEAQKEHSSSAESQSDETNVVKKNEVQQISDEARACSAPKMVSGVLKFEKKLFNLQKHVLRYYKALGKCRNQQENYMKHFNISFLYTNH